jgi:hypothetical protein
MIDPREHLEVITRMAAEITAALDRGEVPSQSDARVLAWNAQVLAEHVKRVNLASIGARSSEADKASQFATLGGERL